VHLLPFLDRNVIVHVMHIQVKVPLTDKPSEMVSFRKLLLNRCQREFEKDKAEELDMERLQKEIDDSQGVR
jgi:hypothetical protein